MRLTICQPSLIALPSRKAAVPGWKKFSDSSFFDCVVICFDRFHRQVVFSTIRFTVDLFKELKGLEERDYLVYVDDRVAAVETDSIG